VGPYALAVLDESSASIKPVPAMEAWKPKRKRTEQTSTEEPDETD
jgi:hypothetical protein